jgi:hypothetical protein
MSHCDAFTGLTVATEVRQSLVPGGGKGRFVLEPVRKGTVVRRTLLVDGAASNDEPWKPGTTTVCRTAAELEQAFNYEDGGEIPNSEQVVNFGGTPYNVGDDNDAIYHWTPCNWLNHAPAEDANVIIELSDIDPHHVRVVALRDIKAGEELYQDYRSFHPPQWFRDWCVANAEGKVDTFTLGNLISPDAPAPVTLLKAAEAASSDDDDASTEAASPSGISEDSD